METGILSTILSGKYTDVRLDKALSETFPEFSRSFLQESIKNGHILVNGKIPRQRDLVRGGEKITFDTAQALDNQQEEATPENLELNIIYEDQALLLVNKPAGMVVHPAPGHLGHTLVNALLYHRPELSNLPRAGIVHRLDKDTSGLLIVAGHREAYHQLVQQMQERQIKREYLSIVVGAVIAGGVIDTAFGRHPRDRKRMAVLAFGGKQAITHYRVEQRFKQHTLLKISLETGRTHQIRVHLAHIRYPVLGDPVYGGRHKIPSANPDLVKALAAFKRQALHAAALEFTHPVTSETCAWQAPLPEDMRQLIELLGKTA